MSLSHKEIFERYIYAGAITRNPDAYADLFTPDGVYEVPLTGHRLEGREAIRAGIGVYQSVSVPGTLSFEKSAYVLHDTADPGVFIAEIDTVFENPSSTMSLVQIFRVRDDRIAHLRDYFRP
ncbi:nuclear transport factor 2 family protein [Paractinoplanes toevensis]|uniref:SnoaL-like domain-containing protein n=1 Tax=Paractinoplanes toevensis TaxID=571911 RepID=A0A920BPK9_9ACTN|nr:nuclear transport factor 2 family protein [Actinoplanes toevensis]GIM96478.1 hypothetical protein Ato02nite_082710 [Actinoplanes toevensis]